MNASTLTVFDPSTEMETLAPGSNGYRWKVSASTLGGKEASNEFDRVQLLSTSGRVMFGAGTAAPTHFIGSTAASLMVSSTVAPAADNQRDLGTATYRWRQIYAGAGTILTSDERVKTAFRSLDEREKAAAMEIRRAIKAFKFSDAVEEKGANARWHFGVGAQTIGDIMRAHGLDPAEYGFWCIDSWSAADAVVDESGNTITPAVAAGSRYGIRYDELAMFILAACA